MSWKNVQYENGRYRTSEGGGGGGGLIISENTYAGKDAGGISGSGDNSANQTTGYAFGQGESGEGYSGGGGGLYGGYKGGTS